jgi:hypothetical protein
MTVLAKAITSTGGTPVEYRLGILDSRNGGPAVQIGDLYLDPADAGLVRAVGELLGGLNPALFLFTWEGAAPPATDLPVAKIHRVMRMFGIV